MIAAMTDAFWHTATQVGEQLLVPVIALIIVMRLFDSALFGNRRS